LLGIKIGTPKKLQIWIYVIQQLTGLTSIHLLNILDLCTSFSTDIPYCKDTKGHRDRDHMVVGFTTTYAIGAYHHWCCEFESWSGQGVQHYVIKYVIDLRQVGGFLQVLQIPPPIKLTTGPNKVLLVLGQRTDAHCFDWIIDWYLS
jgi:hypothetical protein